MNLISVTEAAVIYGCERANMIVLIHSGRIPAKKIGRQWVVEKADVITLREARDARSQPNAWIEPVQEAA